MRRLCYLFALVAALALGTESAQASLIGSQVRVTNQFPNLGDVQEDLGTRTLVDGDSFSSFGLGATLRVTPDGFVIVNDTPGSFNPSAFNGFVIEILSGPTITGVAFDGPASTPNFLANAVLALVGDEIRVNLAGTCAGVCGAGAQLVVDVTTAAVPEPGTHALLAVSLAALVGIRRRPRRST